MKKLLLLMATVLTAIGYAHADTYTFTTDGLSNAEVVTELLSQDGYIKINFEQNNGSSKGSNPPAYYTSGDCIRMYVNNNFTVSATEEGVVINSVSYEWVTKGSSWTKVTVSTETLTVENNQAKLVAASKDNGPRSITVDYTLASIDNRKDAGLAFDKESFVVNLGEEFTSPVATAFEGAEITYSIDNESVATIDAETGALTIVGDGKATVTATSAETEEYKAGEASYSLVVIDPNKLDATFDFTSEQSGTSFTEGMISAEFAKADGNTAPSWYSTGTAMRLYGGNALTISAPLGYHLTEISFTTHTQNNTFNSGTESNFGTLEKLVWTAGNYEKNSVVIKNGGTSGHIRIQTITVKYAKTQAPVAPVLAHNEGVIAISHDEAHNCTFEYRWELVAAEPAVEAYANEEETWYPVENNEINVADEKHDITTDGEKLRFYVRAVKNGVAGEAQTLDVANPGDPSGIADIEVEANASVEYYNLQGVRVAEPACGIYLRRQGDKVSKVVVR